MAARQMFFGQFLLDEEVIGEVDLHRAVELASEENTRIGALAVDCGILTEPQVELVQLEQRQTDLHFADLAVQLELMTCEQSNELLRKQRRRHKPIGEALVELGVLEPGELDDLLDRYHLCELGLDDVHLELPVELAEDDLAPYLIEYFPVLFRRITQIPMKLQACRDWHGRSNLPYRVMQTIEGDCPLTIGIAACPDLATRIGNGLGGPSETAREREEMLGFVREFAEIFSDAGCRSIRRDGLPATVGHAEPDLLPKHGFWFPATTPYGRGILVLSPA